MIKGNGASGGIGIGHILLVKEQKVVFERHRVRDVEKELSKLRRAVEEFVCTTEALAQKLEDEAGAAEAAILRGHILILKDPVLTGEIEKLIRSGECAEAAVEQICNMFISVFSARSDELTQQRAADLEDLKIRLIRHLLGMGDVRLSALPPQTIIVAKELTPSMTAAMDKKNVAGFITEQGGETSHCAIIARACEIPAILGAEGILRLVHNEQMAVMDGSTGEIILSPDEAVRNAFLEKKQQYDRRMELLKTYRGQPTLDADGRQLSVLCNIGNVEDIDKAINGDGEGIGLFRTEFLYMDRKKSPSETEQFEAYRAAALKMAGKPVVIRTLDIGGDKDVPYMELKEEDNPFLGQRAVRYCMMHPDILRQQLRTILKASAFGDVRIMVPMIADMTELRFVRKALEEAKQELRESGETFNEEILLGVMIETPSACLIADLLAKEADFFSIGTNDLIQYTMAADRGNADVSYLYSVFKPSVLRAIRHVIRCAEAAGIPVELCGEAAANPLMTPVLLSFGLKLFSVSPSSVLTIRKEISQYTRGEADRITAAVMEMTDSDSIKDFLCKESSKSAYHNPV